MTELEEILFYAVTENHAVPDHPGINAMGATFVIFPNTMDDPVVLPGKGACTE